MSKRLTKILTISLLAVMVPVAIIIIAICLSTAVSFNLKIDTKGYENVGNISITVNGNEYTDAVRIAKNSEVTVTVSTIGYDFEGWYACEAKDVIQDSEAITDEKSYTFTIVKDTVLTANINIIEYAITYGTETPVNVKYGAALKEAEDEDENVFYGWKIAGDDTIYTTAIFNGDSREITLNAFRENIYEVEESYKSVKINWDYFVVDGLNSDNLFLDEGCTERLSEAISSESRAIDVTASKELSWDINTVKVSEFTKDVAEVYDVAGNKYIIKSYSVIKTGTMMDLDKDATIKEMIDVYKRLDSVVFGTDVVVSIKIEYVKVNA